MSYLPIIQVTVTCLTCLWYRSRLHISLAYDTGSRWHVSPAYHKGHVYMSHLAIIQTMFTCLTCLSYRSHWHVSPGYHKGDVYMSHLAIIRSCLHVFPAYYTGHIDMSHLAPELIQSLLFLPLQSFFLSTLLVALPSNSLQILTCTKFQPSRDE